MINLKDKKVIITGATGDIGKSLVKKFLSLGSMIIATELTKKTRRVKKYR